MKKLFTLATVLGLLAGAQSHAQIRFAPKVGVNFATVSVSNADGFDPKSRVGFHVGAVVDIPVIKILSIQPGLLFNNVGYKTETSILGTTSTSSSSVNYLQVPVNAQLNLPITDALKLNVQVGPYLGYCLGGTSKVGDESSDIKVGSDPDQIKALDYGLNAGVGAEFSNLQLMLTYGLGLANTANTSDDSKVEIKNRNFSISLAYFFGGK